MTKLRELRFKKTDLSSTGEHEFDKDTLALLVAIDKNKTLLQVANEVRLSKEVFKKCLLELYQLKLIEKVEEEIEYLDGSFLGGMRDVLIGLLGPLGETLMDDAALRIGTETAAVPRSMADQYVEAVATEIPGEKQRGTFRRQMEAILNDMA